MEQLKIKWHNFLEYFRVAGITTKKLYWSVYMTRTLRKKTEDLISLQQLDIARRKKEINLKTIEGWSELQFNEWKNKIQKLEDTTFFGDKT